jgi:hypothetical protein
MSDNILMIVTSYKLALIREVAGMEEDKEWMNTFGGKIFWETTWRAKIRDERIILRNNQLINYSPAYSMVQHIF